MSRFHDNKVKPFSPVLLNVLIVKDRPGTESCGGGAGEGRGSVPRKGGPYGRAAAATGEPCHPRAPREMCCRIVFGAAFEVFVFEDFDERKRVFTPTLVCVCGDDVLSSSCRPRAIYEFRRVCASQAEKNGKEKWSPRVYTDVIVPYVQQVTLKGVRVPGADVAIHSNLVVLIEQD